MTNSRSLRSVWEIGKKQRGPSLVESLTLMGAAFAGSYAAERLSLVTVAVSIFLPMSILATYLLVLIWRRQKIVGKPSKAITIVEWVLGVTTGLQFGSTYFLWKGAPADSLLTLASIVTVSFFAYTWITVLAKRTVKTALDSPAAQGTFEKSDLRQKHVLHWLWEWKLALLALGLIVLMVLPPLNYASNSQQSMDINVKPPEGGFSGHDFNVSETDFTFDTVTGFGQVQVSYSATWSPIVFYLTFPFDIKNPHLDGGNITQYGKSVKPGFWFVFVRDYSRGPFILYFAFHDIMSRNLWTDQLSLTIYNPLPIPEIPGSGYFSVLRISQTINVGVSYPDGQALDLANTSPSPTNSFAPGNFFGESWASWTFSPPPVGRSFRVSVYNPFFTWGVPLPIGLKDFGVPIISFLLGYNFQQYRSRKKGSESQINPGPILGLNV